MRHTFFCQHEQEECRSGQMEVYSKQNLQAGAAFTFTVYLRCEIYGSIYRFVLYYLRYQPVISYMLLKLELNFTLMQGTYLDKNVPFIYKMLLYVSTHIHPLSCNVTGVIMDQDNILWGLL